MRGVIALCICILCVTNEAFTVLRLKLCNLLEEHYEVLASLLSHVDWQISVRALELLLSLDKPTPVTVTAKRSVCHNVVAFFYKSLHELHKDERKVLGK